MEAKECKRKNLCYDCNDNKCALAGDPMADCPKYECDREEYFFEDCDSCGFIKRYRAEYRRMLEEENEQS